MKRSLLKRFSLNLHVVALILASSLGTLAASSDVDPGFNPILNRGITDNYSGSAVMQPDGKWIIWGSYNAGNLGGGTFIFRIHSDGTIDPTFDCPECRADGGIRPAIQPDGKILIGGNNRFIRVHANGSLDRSFKTPFSNNPTCNPKFIFPLSDGKAIVHCDGIAVRRLNNNGSLDSSFAEIPVGTSPRRSVAQMVILPDGKILMGGAYISSSGGWVNRYNADGTLDGTFTAVPDFYVLGVGLLADGRYLVTGAFSSINGVSKPKMARLFSDGSVDTGFTAALGTNDYPEDVRTLPNGQFYVRTEHSYFPVPVPSNYRSVRYNADGSIDNTFAQTFFNSTFFWELDALGRIVTFKSGAPSTQYYRLNLDGSVDGTFNPVITVHGKVSAAALQSDGKVLVAGEFQKANGVAVIRFTRLNPDGSNDPTFNSGTGFDIPPDTMAVQSDGKILAAGSFTGYNWFARTRIVRINVDGSTDTSFTPVLNGKVHAIAPLANGKILIGGEFTTVNGTDRKGLAVLNFDGSLDAAFTPLLGNIPHVFTILVQADGKIMVGGYFGSVNGVNSQGIARLHSNGSVDVGFLGNTIRINNIAPRADGKYIVSQRNVGGNDTCEIFRINNNGSRDWSFNSRTGSPSTLVLQSSGNIVYGGTSGITRLGPNGEKDIFFPVYNANDDVNDILIQPDGRLIVAGLFSGIEDVGRHGIARLTLSNRIKGTPFDFDGDGRSDVSVFRPSTNTWYHILSGDGSIGIHTFGAAGDIMAPADYDGDGKTDLGLYRPSIGDFLYIESRTNTVSQRHWGQTGDIPMPADYNVDGIAGLVIYRPSTGSWFGTEGGGLNFGAAGDQPLIGDFDGDGRTDRAVFRPSTGDWWYAASSTPQLEFRQTHWGATGDLPVPADYDGDSKTDFAVFRPSDGGWYIHHSSDGSYTILAFGTSGDRPAPGDYDGDGRADIAVFRPSTGIWYLYMTTSGFAGLQFGIAGDIPTPNAYVP